jgi:hypothetical protein
MPGVVRLPTHYPGPPKHRGRLVPLLRVLLGRPYNGHPRTNAGWSKPGTGHYDPDEAGWWAHQSFRRRMGIIWAVLLTPVISLYGYMVAPEVTVSAQREAAWIAVFILLWITIHRTRRWKPLKQWIEPIHLAAGPHLEMPRKINPRAYISLPRNGEHLTDPDHPITITLPYSFDWPEGPRRAKLAALVAEAGGIGSEFEAYFQLEMEPRTLTVACNPQPPDLVLCDSEVIRLWDEAKPDEVVFGLSHEKTAVKRSFSNDSPHILASIGSGGGKTELACALCLQRRYKVGARVVYFDFVKRGASARWAKDIPGIEVIRHVDVAYRRFLELYDEIEARCEGYWNHGYDEGQDEIFIVLDEANRSMDKLRRYDKLMQTDDKHAPSALDAYEGILHVGREARTRMVVFGQRGSAKGTGGGDAREAFGIILASRFRPNTAKMLFPDVGDGSAASLPRSPSHPGRFQVVAGGRAEEAQGVLMINAKTKQLLAGPREIADQAPAAALAKASTPAPRLQAVPDTPAELTNAEIVDAEVMPETVPSQLVSLRQAADLLQGRWPNITLVALQNYRGKQRSEFPEPEHTEDGTHIYDLAKLDHFLANRPQRKGTI